MIASQLFIAVAILSFVLTYAFLVSMSYRDGVHEYSLRSIFRFFSTFFTHWNLVSMSHWQHYAKQTLNQEFFGRTISKFIIIRELKKLF